jgi:hypothetical protein
LSDRRVDGDAESLFAIAGDELGGVGGDQGALVGLRPLLVTGVAAEGETPVSSGFRF